MKIARINDQQRIILKIRMQLDDLYSPPEFIRRPKGMKPYIFRRNIERLKHHEAKCEALIEEGLMKYIARNSKEGKRATKTYRKQK